jgi:hypothetical protein
MLFFARSVAFPASFFVGVLAAGLADFVFVEAAFGFVFLAGLPLVAAFFAGVRVVDLAVGFFPVAVLVGFAFVGLFFNG